MKAKGFLVGALRIGILISLCVACDGRTDAPYDGVLTFDAGGYAPLDATPPVLDSGTEDASRPDASVSDASVPDVVVPGEGTIGMNPDGILTNVQRLTFINTGINDLTMLNAALRMFQRGDGSWTFFWAGELENVGVNTHCVVDIEVTMAGRDVLSVVDQPMWATESSIGTSRLGCIGPGQRGIFWGVENDLEEGFIDRISGVFYEPTSLVRNEAFLDSASPVVVNREVRLTEDGEWGVRAGFRTNATPIYNFSTNAFPRIEGLLWGAVAIYHLEDVPAFTTFEDQSFSGTDFAFHEFEVIPDYLVRRTMSFLPGGMRTERQRRREVLRGRLTGR
ncbi:MAG: hypothetical protein AB8I08_19505 [Sandaracinaceae bacterium]